MVVEMVRVGLVEARDKAGTIPWNIRSWMQWRMCERWVCMHPGGGFEGLGGGKGHGRRGRVDLCQFMLDYLLQDASVKGAVVP